MRASKPYRRLVALDQYKTARRLADQNLVMHTESWLLRKPVLYRVGEIARYAPHCCFIFRTRGAGLGVQFHLRHTPLRPIAYRNLRPREVTHAA